MSLPDLEKLTLNLTPTLVGLPTELQLMVISYLTLSTSQNLRATCRYFHALFPPQDTVRALLSLEKSRAAQEENVFTCVVCVRLRAAGKFADASRKGPWNTKGDKRETRFCIQCGVKPPPGADRKLRYWKGQTWRRFGLPYIYCKVCCLVKRAVPEKSQVKVCEQCWKNGKG
jgi:hypothetical protein